MAESSANLNYFSSKIKHRLNPSKDLFSMHWKGYCSIIMQALKLLASLIDKDLHTDSKSVHHHTNYLTEHYPTDWASILPQIDFTTIKSQID